MKYLDVIIDNKWAFIHNFRYLETKAVRVGKALCSLLPNLRGPQ